MVDKSISINISQRKVRQKILGLPVPFASHYSCLGYYQFEDGGGQVCGGSNPLECLVNLLVGYELNRPSEQIGSVYASLRLRGKGKQYGPAIKEILKLYARAENAALSINLV
jgi:hypothetical protein